MSHRPIHVTLTDRSLSELRELRESTGLSRVDLVNRAIGLLRLVESEHENGNELAFFDAAAGEFRVVSIKRDYDHSDDQT